MTQQITYSEAETRALAAELASSAERGQVFCLEGDLGVGKTAFAKGFAAGLGVTEDVVSPTFTIVREYEGRIPFYHFDIYRLPDGDSLYDIGFDAYVALMVDKRHVDSLRMIDAAGSNQRQQ